MNQHSGPGTCSSAGRGVRLLRITAFTTALLFCAAVRAQDAAPARDLASSAVPLAPNDAASQPALTAVGAASLVEDDDAGEAARNDEARACLRTIGRRRIAYPPGAFWTREYGIVIVRATFTAADTAPEVRVVYDSGNAILGETVKQAVEHDRLGCFPAGRSRLVTMQRFRFGFGAPESPVKARLTLRELVAYDRRLHEEHVRFDFNTMRCPFFVRFVPYQPYQKNQVTQQSPDPSRRDFIAWLRSLDLDLSDTLKKRVIGQSLTVSVPCTTLDLS